MRSRLFIIFLVPLTSILLVLGGAYALSVNRSIQQEFLNQQIGDVSYFATGARHALRASNPSIVMNEMDRYSELYGAELAVIDRNGAVWASAGLKNDTIDEDARAQIALALSGHRSEAQPAVWPWSLADTVIMEPIFEDGSVIGAVMISASSDAPKSQIFIFWGQLLAVAIALILVLAVAVAKLSNWVLKPLLRVDRAMIAIEQGDMEARIADDTGPPEMRSMIQIFNRMADKIERVLSKQQEFVMNASHELRNPLGALTMRVESLATGLDETWEEDIEKTREEGRRMTRILDTLLETAKAERRDSSFAPVDLRGLAVGRVSAWGVIASERKVGFDLVGPSGLLCMTDRTALESALDAVLDNALKFAPPHTKIQVEVSRSGAADGGSYEIAVRDQGPGLDAEGMQRATDRFWRNPRDQNVPGSGLGLAIASDFLAELGGEVRLAAAPGGGLEVALMLPGGES